MTNGTDEERGRMVEEEVMIEDEDAVLLTLPPPPTDETNENGEMEVMATSPPPTTVPYPCEIMSPETKRNDNHGGTTTPQNKHNHEILQQLPQEEPKDGNDNDDRDNIIPRNELEQRLVDASTILVDRLIRYLESSPTTDEEKKAQPGMSLPAAAIGWLAHIVGNNTSNDDPGSNHTNTLARGGGTASMKERLGRLVPLLPLATHVRVTTEEWPPPPPKTEPTKPAASTSSSTLPSSSSPSSHSSPPRGWNKFRRKLRNVAARSPAIAIDSTPVEEEGSSVTSSLDGESVVSTAVMIPSKQQQQLEGDTVESLLRQWTIRPRVDMSLFPGVTVLILDGVPPEWIVHMEQTQTTLRLLRVERGCIYNLNQFLFPSIHTDNPNIVREREVKEKEEASQVVVKEPTAVHDALLHVNQIELSNESSEALVEEKGKEVERMGSSTLPTYTWMTHLKLSHCAIGELACLRGTRRKRKRLIIPPPLSRFPNLVTLSLSHNEIIHMSTALAGLSSLPLLSTLDLSHNRLTSMEGAFRCLGNVKSLILTGNQITSTRGLERLYALERLDLEDNNISALPDVAGIAGLPDLEALTLSGNPLEQTDATRYRVQLFNLFRESRYSSLPPKATFRDILQLLPVLDGVPATKREMMALKRLTFVHSPPPMSITTTISNTTKATQHVHGAEDDVSEGTMRDSRSSVVASVDDVDGGFEQNAVKMNPFRSLVVAPQMRLRTVRKVRRRTVPIMDMTNKDTERAKDDAREEVDLDDCCYLPLKTNGLVRNIQTQRTAFSVMDVIANLTVTENMIEPVAIDSLEELHGRVDTTKSTNGKKIETPTSAPIGEPRTHDEGQHTAPRTFVEEYDMEFARTNGADDVTPFRSYFAPISYPFGDDDFSFSAAGGPDIANGQVYGEKNDVAQLAIHGNHNSKGGSQDEQATPRVGSHADSKQRRGDQESTSAITFFDDSRILTLHNEQWGDDADMSVLTGLETQIPGSKDEDADYTVAEKTSAYDGPSGYGSLSVRDNLDLYFSVFVFPPVDDDDPFASVDEERTEVTSVGGSILRIQLGKADRALLKSSYATLSTNNMTRIGPSSDGAPTCLIQSEKLLRVWTEEIFSCGTSATARVMPNRMPLRGFHGEIVWAEDTEAQASDCRNVILCLSDSAFYIIPDHDAIASTTEKEVSDTSRHFPSPFPRNSTFKDALWPHALARHPTQYLDRITIGFGFQHLILHFHVEDDKDDSPETRKSTDFTYVLYTCNKLRTISLLQQLQDQLKESRSMGGFSVEEGMVKIDNDDKIVLDALALALAPAAVGVILHFQALRQRWRSGDREAVRRVCVVTDTKIYLLDESFVGDGSSCLHKDDDMNNTTTPSPRQDGDVTLGFVDMADLKQISEVHAAGEDPRLITLVIQPLSRLQRVHRWRLVCRDGEGAERLIDDVRKAIAMCD